MRLLHEIYAEISVEEFAGFSSEDYQEASDAECNNERVAASMFVTPPTPSVLAGLRTRSGSAAATFENVPLRKGFVYRGDETLLCSG